MWFVKLDGRCGTIHVPSIAALHVFRSQQPKVYIARDSVIASQGEIKVRIDDLRLNHSGYARQLGRPGLSPDRRQRLELDVALLEEEISTLEKIHQLGRVEPDQAKIESIVQERLDVLAVRYSQDLSLAHLELGEIGAASGEAKALMWALGRDPLTIAMQEIMKSHGPRDLGRTDRAMPNILRHALEEGPDPDTRASAAYELGKLRVKEAIPWLLKARGDPDSFVAQVALSALAQFSDEDLAAVVGADTLQAISAVRTTAGGEIST